MIINDTVGQVQGSSLLVGTVRETKKENGWLFAKVEWALTEAQQSIRTNVENMLAIRRQEYDPETEWIRCSKLININPAALIEVLRQYERFDD
jgi:hypothetical protein